MTFHLSTRFIAVAKTLLDIVGFPATPSRMEDAALVIVDAQNEYLSGNLRLEGIEAAVGEIKRLLLEARALKSPVFHVVHHGWAGSPIFAPAGPYVEVIQDLEPEAGEAIVVKTLPNSFAKTDLQEKIRKTGRTELIIVGFMTHMCVSTTVRAALDLGYKSTVFAKATATRDLPNPLGGIIKASELQAAALAALADRFAAIV